MNNLLIMGAGGHGKVVADAADAMQKWKEICFLDDHVSSCNGMGVVGKFADLPALRQRFPEVMVAVGDNHMRDILLLQCMELGFRLPIIIHPTSWISKFAKIGHGSVVFANTAINANAQIGYGCIINTAAVVEHDCVIDDCVHLSPNATLAGKVKVGKYSWIGAGATVINDMSVGDNVIIGANSLVINEISSNVTAVGSPAKIIKS
jgi:sugar O-acyltransferase (sialic acid O-acetyltransferase NeuD family)